MGKIIGIGCIVLMVERESIRAVSEKRKADAQAHLAMVMWAALTVLPVVGALWYVHTHLGPDIVLVVLAIIFVLGIGFLFAWMNDRSQERAQRHSADMANYISKGINESMAQNARTQGEFERQQFRVIANEILQKQRLDTGKQLIDHRNKPEFDDYDIDIEDNDYEEVY